MIGFSEGFHDAAVAVVNDGKICYATHSERYSKKTLKTPYKETY